MIVYNTAFTYLTNYMIFNPIFHYASGAIFHLTNSSSDTMRSNFINHEKIISEQPHNCKSKIFCILHRLWLNQQRRDCFAVTNFASRLEIN